MLHIFFLNVLEEARRRFFYNDKSGNSKRYPFANVKSFWHLMWKTFCHTGGANSIKTNLQFCNAWTGQSVNLFWLNLPHQNGKTFFTSNVKNFSHLQMDIFCCFDFCHCRRNAFWRDLMTQHLVRLKGIISFCNIIIGMRCWSFMIFYRHLILFTAI